MRSTVYRDAALADGRSARLQVGVSLLAEDGRVRWIRPAGEEGERPPGCEVVDAGGTTIVPGLVDGHSHLTLPGGSHWIERGADPTGTLVAVAESNGELQYRSGVRWARDVGSPRRAWDGGERAVAIGVRDRWRGRRDRPYVRAAGTWITVAGMLPGGLSVEARDADGLLAAAVGQLEDGADFVKLYLDGPDPGTAPWTAAEVGRVAAAVHARGAKVTAHATRLSGARVCAEAGVDSIEHGFELDADVAALMAARGVALVTTMTVLKSWLSFGTTTAIPRFAGPGSQARIRDQLEQARYSVRLAHAAGVAIVGGTDFGGGSARANQLPWEVECLVEAGLEPWEALAAGKQGDRRERVAAIRAQQQRAERRRNLITIGAIIAAAAVIIGAVAWCATSRGSGSGSGATAEVIPPGVGSGTPIAQPAALVVPNTSGIDGVVAYDTAGWPTASHNGPAAHALPHSHVNGPVHYSVTPPVGGDHNATWMNCGIYTQRVPNERAVHNLEHGAVWITYQPSLPQSEVSQLRAFVDKQTKVSPGGAPASRYMDLTILALPRAMAARDNIYIHFPGHDALMLTDVVNGGWVPIYNLNLSDDVPGYIGAPAIALDYPWTHFISGHMGRLATRDDVAVHQAYIADIEASAQEALTAVDPVPYYIAGGENFWAGVKGHLEAVTERAAAPVIAKYTGVLAAADVEGLTYTTTFAIMTSLRLDRGPSGPVPIPDRPRPGQPGPGQHRPRSGLAGCRATGTRSRRLPVRIEDAARALPSPVPVAEAVDFGSCQPTAAGGWSG